MQGKQRKLTVQKAEEMKEVLKKKRKEKMGQGGRSGFWHSSQ